MIDVFLLEIYQGFCFTKIKISSKTMFISFIDFTTKQNCNPTNIKNEIF